MTARDTIPAETCLKCGRPRPAGTCVDVYETCARRGSSGCRHAAAAYRRGIDKGVRLAKEHAYVDKHGSIRFGDVNKAAAKAKGEA